MAEGRTITIIQKGKEVVKHYIIFNLTCPGCQLTDVNGHLQLTVKQGNNEIYSQDVGTGWFKNQVTWKYEITDFTQPVNVMGYEGLWVPEDCSPEGGSSVAAGCWWNGQCYDVTGASPINQFNHTFPVEEFQNSDLYINLQIREECP